MASANYYLANIELSNDITFYACAEMPHQVTQKI